MHTVADLALQQYIYVFALNYRAHELIWVIIRGKVSGQSSKLKPLFTPLTIRYKGLCFFQTLV